MCIYIYMCIHIVNKNINANRNNKENNDQTNEHKKLTIST